MPVPFIPVPNCWQVNMQLTQEGQQVENVFHVHDPGAMDIIGASLVAAAVMSWWVASIKPLVSASVQLIQVVATDLTTQTGVTVTDAAPGGTLGSLGGGRPPNSVTVAVKWNTRFRGRSFRGRTYHIGLVDTQVVNSTLDVTFQGNLRLAYDALIAGIGALGSGQSLVVASKFHNKAPRVSGIVTDIINASIEPTIDSQRRRLPGRGR